MGLIPGLGRSLGGGHGNPLQYSCLENCHEQKKSLAGYSPWGRRVGHNWVTKHTQHSTYHYWISKTLLQVKEVSHKRLQTEWLYLHKILEKAKLHWRKTDCQVIRGERRLSAKLWHSKLMSVMETFCTLIRVVTQIYSFVRLAELYT